MGKHMENHTENLRTSRMLEGKQVLKSCTSEGFIVAFGKQMGHGPRCRHSTSQYKFFLFAWSVHVWCLNASFWSMHPMCVLLVTFFWQWKCPIPHWLMALKTPINYIQHYTTTIVLHCRTYTKPWFSHVSMIYSCCGPLNWEILGTVKGIMHLFGGAGFRRPIWLDSKVPSSSSSLSASFSPASGNLGFRWKNVSLKDQNS